MERAKLEAGSLLKLRTGRGVWHAKGIGQDELREGKAGTQMCGLLFWVNLARKDKGAEPSAQLLHAHEVPVRARRRRDRAGAGRGGSPVELGTPGLVLDVELPTGGGIASLVPPGFNGFVYVLEGQASFGAGRRRATRSQIAVLGPGGAIPWSKRGRGHGSCSWPGSPTAGRRSTTDRMWTNARSAQSPSITSSPSRSAICRAVADSDLPTKKHEQ